MMSHMYDKLGVESAWKTLTYLYIFLLYISRVNHIVLVVLQRKTKRAWQAQCYRTAADIHAFTGWQFPVRRRLHKHHKHCERMPSKEWLPQRGLFWPLNSCYLHHETKSNPTLFLPGKTPPSGAARRRYYRMKRRAI